MISHFNAFNINSIPRLQNVVADFLAIYAARLVPTNNKCTIELILRPAIPDNVTNMRVFDDDDNQNINFLKNDETVKDYLINDEEHQANLQNGEVTQGNFMPKGVRTLEGMFYLHKKFIKPSNVNTNSSSMQYELINLETEAEPKYVNMGSCCSPRERSWFINLF